VVILDKHNLVYKYAIGILLLLYIGGMVLLNITTPKKVFSESENRKLEQVPHFSLNELFHGKFTSNYEKYISDQFAFRDFWIGVKSELERTMGKKESNGVYLGKDGYLLQAFNKPDDKSFNNKIDAINTFDESTPELSKYFMLVPNSVKILSDKLPDYAPVEDEIQYINKVRSSINKNIEFVDIYDVLNSKKDEYIFYKTDHHWTTKTAFYAYEKLGAYMGFIPHEENYFNIKKVTESFYGSLYSKGGFRDIDPDSIELYISKKNEVNKVEYVDEHKFSNSIYYMENLNKKDKYAVFFGGNHGLIKISTNADSRKKLLVVKDSYANCLIPFLIGHYSEIYVVDPRYYSDDLKELIKSNSINNMLILYNVNTFFEEESIENISE